MTILRRGTKENSLTPFNPLDFLPRDVAVTGRIPPKAPDFKDFSMDPYINTPDDLSPAERQLSELLFARYHPNPGLNGTSPLTNRLARNLRGDKAHIQLIATCLAKMVAPEHADKLCRVVGFYVEPNRPSGDIGDSLKVMIGDDENKTGLELLIDQPIITPSGQIDPHVLWAHACLELQKYYADVSFDHEYYHNPTGSYQPAIHGEGVNRFSVNGAILLVLEHNGLLDWDYQEFRAVGQDADGWVYGHWDLS